MDDYCDVWPPDKGLTLTHALHGCSLMQVEKVICYDVFQSPLRGIQRVGRTGRHEEGRVVHILCEGHEETKFHNNAEVSFSKVCSEKAEMFYWGVAANVGRKLQAHCCQQIASMCCVRKG